MRRRASLALRLLVAGVFGYAGASKLLDPAAFAASIDAFRLVPSAVAAVLAVFLPWLEIIVAVALLWRRTRDAAAWLITLMLVAFTAALVTAAFRGLDVSCGCFGASPSLDGYRWPVTRNLTLLTSMVFLWTLTSREASEIPASNAARPVG